MAGTSKTIAALEKVWDAVEQEVDKNPHETLEPPANLMHLKELMTKDLKLDYRSCCAFVELVTSSPYGQHEGYRILSHLMKDSDSGRSWTSKPSGWIVHAVREAQQALQQWQAWTSAAESSNAKARNCTE